MNKVIWKFPLAIKDRQVIKIPYGFEILTVQVQKDIPCIWALVNPNDFYKDITIEIRGTGFPIED